MAGLVVKLFESRLESLTRAEGLLMLATSTADSLLFFLIVGLRKRIWSMNYLLLD